MWGMMDLFKPRLLQRLQSCPLGPRYSPNSIIEEDIGPFIVIDDSKGSPLLPLSSF
jgi:hypothetical protein